jgi:hypothetical protein
MCFGFVSPPIKVSFLKTHWRVAARPFSQATKGLKSAWCDIGYAPVYRTFSANVIKRPPAFDHCTRVVLVLACVLLRPVGLIGF